MSLETFITAAEADIKKIENEIETAVVGAVHEIETVILPLAIALGNGLKLITTADAGDFIGGIFGKAGIAIEDETRVLVASILPKLQFAQSLQGKSLQDIVTAVTPILEGSTSDPRTKLVIDFVAQATQDFAANKGIKLTIAQAIQLSQLYYSEISQIDTEAANPGQAVADAREAAKTQ